MKISNSIFKDYINSFKYLLKELFEHEKLGNSEKGWNKSPDLIKIFKIPSQETADLMAEVFNKTAEKVSKIPSLSEVWEYGILHNDSIYSPFLSDVLVMKKGSSYRIHSINVGYTKKVANEMGFYYSKNQFPTLKQVIKDYTEGNFKHYNSLISESDELQPFNKYTDRLADYNWLNTVIPLYIEIESENI